MKFCPKCERAMVRDTSSGVVVYHCTVCEEVVQGTEWDARVGGAVLGAGETTEMYKRLIEVSPFDRTNQLVFRDCKNCGRDYMTQIRVGESEVIVHTCKCGAVVTGKSSFMVEESKETKERASPETAPVTDSSGEMNGQTLPSNVAAPAAKGNSGAAASDS